MMIQKMEKIPQQEIQMIVSKDLLEWRRQSLSGMTFDKFCRNLLTFLKLLINRATFLNNYKTIYIKTTLLAYRAEWVNFLEKNGSKDFN